MSADERCGKTDLLKSQCSHCLGQDGPPPPHIPIVEMRASELFDYAASNTRWTKLMACETLGWSEHTLAEVIRALRKILAGDDINVVVGYEDGDWYYKLVGDLASAMPWATIRLRSVEAQLATIADVTSSICNATSDKSRDGRKARMIQGQINILQLQLANLEGS